MAKHNYYEPPMIANARVRTMRTALHGLKTEKPLGAPASLPVWFLSDFRRLRRQRCRRSRVWDKLKLIPGGDDEAATWKGIDQRLVVMEPGNAGHDRRSGDNAAVNLRAALQRNVGLGGVDRAGQRGVPGDGQAGVRWQTQIHEAARGGI